MCFFFRRRGEFPSMKTTNPKGWSMWIPSLKLAANAPENLASQKGKDRLPSINLLLVSGRVDRSLVKLRNAHCEVLISKKGYLQTCM